MTQSIRDAARALYSACCNYGSQREQDIRDAVKAYELAALRDALTTPQPTADERVERLLSDVEMYGHANAVEARDHLATVSALQARINELESTRITDSEMPAYGFIQWEALIEAVCEAMTGNPKVGWERDPSYYVGHQPVDINMNSLNRIVSKFVASAQDRINELESRQAELQRLAEIGRLAVPPENTPEAANAIDAALAEYDYPANARNAARAGWRACRQYSTGKEQP